MSNNEINSFETYMETNPRAVFPNKEIKEFLEYAILRYSDYLKVNCIHADCSEEQDENVKDYIGECSEALLLFSEWIKSKNKDAREQGKQEADAELQNRLRRIKECLDYYDSDQYWDRDSEFETPEEGLIHDIKLIVSNVIIQKDKLGGGVSKKQNKEVKD